MAPARSWRPTCSGFARMAPDELIREDELEVVPLLQLGLSTGFLDQVWSTRLGRGYAEGLRLIARVEKEVWQARFMAPMLASGADQQTAMELAAQRGVDLNVTPLRPRAYGRLPQAAGAGLDRAAGRGHRGSAGRHRRPRAA